MLRHGFTATGLREAGRGRSPSGASRSGSRASPCTCRWPAASHLSEVRPADERRGRGRRSPTRTVWVSHLTDAELAALRAAYPDFTFRPRIGTDLWLGDRGALTVRATVLDVHPVERGDVFGYRGRTAPKRRHHPRRQRRHRPRHRARGADRRRARCKDRAATVARGGLDAAGFVRSPYTIDGKQRLFAEPPHMQASMLFLPHGAPVPAVGDEVDVRVRYTATTFDRVDIS